MTIDALSGRAVGRRECRWRTSRGGGEVGAMLDVGGSKGHGETSAVSLYGGFLGACASIGQLSMSSICE